MLDVEACKSLRSARTTFTTAATNRSNLLAKLGTLPNRSALPPALLADLTTAWQASAQADGDLHDWAQDLISGGCHKGKTHDDQKYKDSLGPDSTASSAKARFTQEWQPLAQKYEPPRLQDRRSVTSGRRFPGGMRQPRPGSHITRTPRMFLPSRMSW